MVSNDRAKLWEKYLEFFVLFIPKKREKSYKLFKNHANVVATSEYWNLNEMNRLLTYVSIYLYIYVSIYLYILWRNMPLELY